MVGGGEAGAALFLETCWGWGVVPSSQRPGWCHPGPSFQLVETAHVLPPCSCQERAGSDRWERSRDRGLELWGEGDREADLVTS